MATESGSTDIVKGKRGGANKPYSDEVRQYLEAVFTVCPLPEEYVKYRLHLATGLEVKQINSWFSNRRQKAKRSLALGPGQQLEDGQPGQHLGLEGSHLGPNGEALDSTPTSVSLGLFRISACPPRSWLDVLVDNPPVSRRLSDVLQVVVGRQLNLPELTNLQHQVRLQQHHSHPVQATGSGDLGHQQQQQLQAAQPAYSSPAEEASEDGRESRSAVLNPSHLRPPGQALVMIMTVS